MSSPPHSTVPRNAHTYSSAAISRRPNPSILQLSLISLSADEGTDCSPAHPETADAVACFQSESLHNSQSVATEVESLPRRLSEPLAKRSAEPGPQNLRWSSSVEEFEVVGKLKSTRWLQRVSKGECNEVNDRRVRSLCATFNLSVCFKTAQPP